MSLYWNELKKGPPDLEEWFKKLGRSFAARKKNPFATGPDSKESSSWWWLGISLIIIAVVLVFSSVVTVAPTERMVIMRFGAFNAVEGPGLHWTIPLIDQRTVVDVDHVETLADSALLPTQDGSAVQVTVALNYVIDDPKAYLFYGAVPIILQKQLAAATLQVLAKQSAVSLLSTNTWPALSAQIEAALPDFTSYGVKIKGVDVSNISVPEALSASFNALILSAQNQSRQMVDQANQFAASIQPLGDAESAEVLQNANLQQFAIVVNAQRAAADLSSLQAAYAVNPGATLAYLPILLAQKNRVSTALEGQQVMQSGQSAAYLRWHAASQAQAEETANAENN
jgi:membrane protease subunit HflK